MQITSEMLNKIQILEMGILIVRMVFHLVKIVLVAICVMIIYSLLLLSVESKYFEMAVTRMLGL